jgi:hypothetical protein
MSAASLCLALISQGLCLEVKPRPAAPDGFVIRVHGIKRLDPTRRAWALRMIFTNKRMIRDFMCSGSPDALAVRAEGNRAGRPNAQSEHPLPLTLSTWLRARLGRIGGGYLNLTVTPGTEGKALHELDGMARVPEA